MSEGLEFVAKHWEQIRGMAKQRSSGREWVEEILIDVAIDRVPRACELYDPSYGNTLEQYVFDSLRRYMIKKLMTLKGEEPEAQPALEDLMLIDESSNNLDTQDQVQYLLQGLSDYHRWLLLTYHGGWNFTEIAESLGVSKCTIRNHYYDALELAQEIAEDAQGS